MLAYKNRYNWRGKLVESEKPENLLKGFSGFLP